MRFSPAIPSALCALTLLSASAAHASCDRSGLPPTTEIAELETPLGSICIELLRADAPKHVENFLYYLRNNLIAGTFFHRSVPGFVIQGGGFTVGQDDFEPVPPFNGNVMNEPCTLDTPADPMDPGGTQVCSYRGNDRGSVALAKNAGDPSSGNTNWYINLADNRENLDNQNGGFTVFGQVVEGMDVVDAIAALPIAHQTNTGFGVRSDDLVWIETALESSPVPLLEAPLSDPYGCFDPSLQVTVLDTGSLPSLVAVADPVVVPALLPLLPFTLSSPCGTPTTLASFVPNPPPPGCQDPQNDRIAVATTGPRSLLFPSGSAVFTALTCLEVEEALAQRALWRADYDTHLKDNLVLVTNTSVSGFHAVPALPALALGLFAVLLVIATRRRPVR